MIESVIAGVSLTDMILVVVALVVLLEVYIRVPSTEYDARAKAIQQALLSVLSLLRGRKKKLEEDESEE